MEAILADADEGVAEGRSLDGEVRKMLFQLGFPLARNLFLSLQKKRKCSPDPADTGPIRLIR